MRSTMFIGRTVVACAGIADQSNASSAGTRARLLNRFIWIPLLLYSGGSR